MKTELLRTVRQSFQILVGALVLLHLSPLVTTAWATMQPPLNDVRLVDHDILRLSDIFANVPQDLDKALGPSPQPGQDIVLNARTLMKLAMAYGLNWRPNSAGDQVTIRRDGTFIEPDMIEDALMSALNKKGVTGNFELAFNSPLTSIVLGKNARTDLTITRLDYNPAKATFNAILTPVATPTRPVGVSGAIERLIDVPVARNTLGRGDLITAADIDTMSVRESQLKADAIVKVSDVIGQTPRRVITPGKLIAANDIEAPLSVRRGDKVTLIYRTGALELSVQGRAGQDGHTGDRISVSNNDSRKNLQGTVVENGRVVID